MISSPALQMDTTPRSYRYTRHVRCDHTVLTCCAHTALVVLVLYPLGSYCTSCAHTIFCARTVFTALMLDMYTVLLFCIKQVGERGTQLSGGQKQVRHHPK